MFFYFLDGHRICSVRGVIFYEEIIKKSKLIQKIAIEVSLTATAIFMIYVLMMAA